MGSVKSKPPTTSLSLCSLLSPNLMCSLFYSCLSPLVAGSMHGGVGAVGNLSGAASWGGKNPWLSLLSAAINGQGTSLLGPFFFQISECATSWAPPPIHAVMLAFWLAWPCAGVVHAAIVALISTYIMALTYSCTHAWSETWMFCYRHPLPPGSYNLLTSSSMMTSELGVDVGKQEIALLGSPFRPEHSSLLFSACQPVVDVSINHHPRKKKEFL